MFTKSLYTLQVIAFWPKTDDAADAAVQWFVEFSCRASLENALAKSGLVVRKKKASAYFHYQGWFGVIMTQLVKRAPPLIPQ
jgi:hypothetical protein